MRKSGNKKKEISKSKRLMAVCLSMTFILGSMSYLAFADENEEEIPSDDPVIEEVAPVVEETVAEETSDEEEAVAGTTDTEEVVEETDEEVVEEEAVAEVETVTETEEVSVPVTNASVGTTYYVGSKTESSNSVYYSFTDYTGLMPFRFGGSTVPKPTYSRGNWTFRGVYYNGGDLSMPGSADKTPIGMTIVSGTGAANNPFMLQLVYHTHSFVLSAEDNVASVKCTAPVCYDYETDVEYDVTLEADDTVYTGEAVEATATVDDGFPTEVTVGDVKYVGSGDTSYAESTTAPTDAGTYSASVTITLGESSATATVDFEIDKADASIKEYPVIIAENYEEEVFITDSPVDLIVEAGVADGGTLLYSLDGENFSEEFPKATEPGEYYVYIYVKGDSNHYDTTVVHSWPLYIVNYAFTEGADATWDKDADKDKTLTFTIKRSRLDDQTYGNVEKVYVDGEELNDSSYNLEAGSAIITLSADYLKTLADGKHSFKVEFSDPYSVETNFSITSSSAPQTGEYAGTFVLVIGAVMAAAGAAFVIKAKKA